MSGDNVIPFERPEKQATQAQLDHAERRADLAVKRMRRAIRYAHWARERYDRLAAGLALPTPPKCAMCLDSGCRMCGAS